MSVYLSKIGSFFAMFSQDMTFILSLLLLFWASTLYFGKGKIVSFILSFYPATFLYKSFPFIDKLTFLTGDKLVVVNKLGLFLLFSIPIYIIINSYVFSVSEYTGTSHLVRGGALAIASLVTVMLFYYTTLDLSIFHDFGPRIDSLFAGNNLVFYWNLGVIAILAIF
ncbi:MAG: hypothetical protein ABL917_01470 [Parcubacteria group bacterium]